MNAIAEVLATCRDAQFRDGEEALRFARRACMTSEWENHEYLATLAAAYAEAGDFESAIRWQRRSVDMAPGELKDEGQQQLDLYRDSKPYHADEKEAPSEATNAAAESS